MSCFSVLMNDSSPACRSGSPILQSQGLKMRKCGFYPFKNLGSKKPLNRITAPGLLDAHEAGEIAPR